MTLFITSVFFVFGLVIGSFLNVCIYRIPQNISVAKGRSYCPNCKITLSPPELFPVLSYLFLGGKCKTCKEKISPRYAMVELLTAVLFALCGYVFGIMRLELGVIYALFFAVLVVVAFIDIDTMEVPDRMHVFILAFALAKIALFPSDWLGMLIGAVIVSLPMLVIALFTGGFGGADIKLMAVSGLLLGAKSIVVSFLLAVVLMGSFGIVMVIRKLLFKRAYAKKVPFCPALAFGCVVGALFGDMIANWYLNLFIL